MNASIYSRSFLGLVLIGLVSVAAADNGYNADPAAVDVVEQYLDALSNADVPGIERTLSNEMLEEKRASLENESYPELLTRLYAGSTYQVEGTEPAANGGVLVSTKMLVDGKHTRTFRFLVEPQVDGSYKIAEEL